MRDDKNEAPNPPAAAARHVVTSTNEVFAGSADKTDPPLNPNHPSHNIRTPAAADLSYNEGYTYWYLLQHV